MEKIINSNSIVIACRCKLPKSVLVCVYICMLCNAEIPVVKDKMLTSPNQNIRSPNNSALFVIFCKNSESRTPLDELQVQASLECIL